MIKVCIEKDDSGAFSVYQENEQAGETTEAIGQETMAQEQAEQQERKPARDIQDALMIAARMLSQKSNGAAQQMFDQGMKETAPQMTGQQAGM